LTEDLGARSAERADVLRGCRGRNAPYARRDTAFAALLFVIAFALRLWAAQTLAGEPVWDGHYYDFGARHIASGFGYADEVMRDGQPVWHPWCHYPVGYSAYLAVFYKFLGSSHLVGHVANAFASGLLPVVTFLLAREALSERRAMAAGALAAIHPGLVLYGALVMAEPLSALLVLTGFYVALRVARTGRRSMSGIASGALVLGLAALVRPQSLLCAPFLALVVPGKKGWEGATAVFGREMAWRPRLAGAVVACCVALVPVLPWTARNCRVMDGCALVSTNAGWNLAIGSFPRATGRFETLRSEDGCREVTGQVQQDRCWFEYGLANIRRDPVRWLKLVPAKLAQTFDHESFAVEYLREARPQAWPEDRRVAWRGVLTSVHRLFVAASALAFVSLSIRRDPRDARGRARMVQAALVAVLALGAYAAFAADTPTFWPIVLVACVLPWLPVPGRPSAHPALLMPLSLVITTALTHAVFFGEDRYHIVASPVLCLLAAAALRRPEKLAA
jgi:hypothetical protein